MESAGAVGRGQQGYGAKKADQAARADITESS